jgi:hypothetical protein
LAHSTFCGFEGAFVESNKGGRLLGSHDVEGTVEEIGDV